MSEKWPRVRLGEVLRPVDTSVPVTQLGEVNLAGVYSFGRGLFKRGPMSPAESSYRTYNRLVVDDYVISQPKAWEGAIARVTPEFDGWFLSPVFPTFRADRQNLEPKYLEWFGKRESVWLELQQRSRGIGARRETVSPEQFLSLEIPLPPLAEQRRVVARIEGLAAQIQEARALRRQAGEEVEAIYSATIAAWAASLGSETKTVDQIVGQDALRNGKSVKTSDEPGTVRCLTLSSMRLGRVNLSDNKPVPLTSDEARPFFVQRGDVFVVRGNGSKELCGKAGLVEQEITGVIFPDLFIRVPLTGSGVLPKFFVAFWNAGPVREVIEDKAKTTSGIWKVNQGHIGSTAIPVPPLPEQRRIVAELDTLQTQVDALKRLQAETAAELDALLPAILDRAFKGEF